MGSQFSPIYVLEGGPTIFERFVTPRLAQRYVLSSALAVTSNGKGKLSTKKFFSVF